MQSVKDRMAIILHNLFKGNKNTLSAAPYIFMFKCFNIYLIIVSSRVVFNLDSKSSMVSLTRKNYKSRNWRDDGDT
jgi:hypothetical protein